jgi:predicted outer membrane repeat protein
MATLSSIITPSNITTATNTQTLTNKTLTGAAMNGTLGATTPSTGAFTTLSSTASMKSGTTGTNGHLQLARSSDGATITNFVTDGTNGIINSVLDTIFQGNTTERMRITSAGHLGIGTASPASKLHVSGAGADIRLTDTQVANATWRILAQTFNTTKLFRIFDESNALDRLVINSSGDVGIGTASPASKLHLSSTGQTVLTITGDSDSSGADVGYTGITMNWSGAERWNIGPAGTGTNNLVFRGAGSNLMTLTTGGNLGIGTASPGASLDVNGTLRSWGNCFLSTGNTNTDPVASRVNGLCVQGAAIYMRNGLTMKWGLSGNGDHVLFFSDNGAAAVQGGGINTTGSTTAFNTTSDARLKTNLRQIANSGSIIDAIRPVLHDWKTGETDSYGFLAQELIEVFPRAVTAGDNDSEVSKPWGVDMSKLIPVLVAEIKSMRARIAALESN